MKKTRQQFDTKARPTMTVRLSDNAREKLKILADHENRTTANWLENQILEEWDKFNEKKQG
jgi:predicted transcriptional regulator